MNLLAMTAQQVFDHMVAHNGDWTTFLHHPDHFYDVAPFTWQQLVMENCVPAVYGGLIHACAHLTHDELRQYAASHGLRYPCTQS